VSVPRFVAERLGEHVAGRAPDDLVFTSPQGEPRRASNFRRDVFTPATRRVGVDGLVPHGLRHTAASLAIAAGADVKVVQQVLGHKSATMTLDRYGHLFDDRLDEVADALDRAARASTPPRDNIPAVPSLADGRSSPIYRRLGLRLRQGVATPEVGDMCVWSLTVTVRVSPVG
jgi:hypothetical protein